MRGAGRLLPLLVLAVAQSVEAQVTARAELVVAAPTGNGTRDLSFGAIAPLGAPAYIDVPAARTPISGTRYAGEFRFDIATSRGLDFRVTVPMQLTAASRPPLALSFDGVQYGGHCVTVNGSACTLTQFNPAAAANVRVCQTMLGNGTCHANRFFSTGSELSVYVGGMLTVPPTAPAGTYTGTITLTVVQVY